MIRSLSASWRSKGQVNYVKVDDLERDRQLQIINNKLDFITKSHILSSIPPESISQFGNQLSGNQLPGNQLPSNEDQKQQNAKNMWVVQLINQLKQIIPQFKPQSKQISDIFSQFKLELQKQFEQPENSLISVLLSNQNQNLKMNFEIQLKNLQNQLKQTELNAKYAQESLMRDLQGAKQENFQLSLEIKELKTAKEHQFTNLQETRGYLGQIVEELHKKLKVTKISEFTQQSVQAMLMQVPEDFSSSQQDQQHQKQIEQQLQELLENKKQLEQKVKSLTLKNQFLANNQERFEKLLQKSTKPTVLAQQITKIGEKFQKEIGDLEKKLEEKLRNFGGVAGRIDAIARNLE